MEAATAPEKFSKVDLGDVFCMNTNEIADVMELWLKGKPETIKRLARRLPPGTKIESHGQTLYVVAYTEDGGVKVSKTDPAEDFRTAIQERQPICRCCLESILTPE